MSRLCVCVCVHACTRVVHYSYVLCQYDDLIGTHRLLLTVYNSTTCQRKRRTIKNMLLRQRSRREKLPYWLVNNWYVSSICI